MVSIIIPTFNKLELTTKCLDSLLLNTDKKFLDDVWIVDNKSTDGTVDFLNKINWVKKICNENNLGFSKACNQGATAAKGDVLIFLNNDTEVQKNWLETLLLTIEKQNATVVGSKLLFPNGKIQHAGIVISSDFIPRHLYYGESSEKKYVNKKREFQAVTAACIAVVRDEFLKVGGFDERYKNGLEDIDLCLRLRKAGKKIYYCPESVVVHHESMSEGRFDHITYNEHLFLTIWKNKIQPDEIDFYKKDKRNFLYIKIQEMKRKYLNKDNLKEKSLGFKFERFFFLFFYRLIKTVILIVRLDIKTLIRKTVGVLNAKS